MIAIPKSLRWYLTVVLNYIQMKLFDIWMSSLEKYLLSFSAYFSTSGFFCCYWVDWVPYIFWVSTTYSIYGLQIFSSFLQDAVSFFYHFDCCAEIFYFDMVPFVYFCFCCLYFSWYIQNSLPRPMSRSFFSTFSARR